MRRLFNKSGTVCVGQKLKLNLVRSKVLQFEMSAVLGCVAGLISKELESERTIKHLGREQLNIGQCGI